MRFLLIEKQIDYAPLGLLYLSSTLRRAGHEVRLAVAAAEDPVAVARQWEPDVVGYSVYTGSQAYYRDLNLQIKAALPGVVSVFGGPHPTYFPEFVEEPGVDAVCLGEGEGAILDLAAALEQGGPLANIDNWWFKSDGEVERNPLRPLEDDLDRLPFPDRELLFDRDSLTRQSGIKHFITSRGCPYDCTYCFNHALGELYRGKGRRLRQASVGRVIEEVRGVRARYPMQFVVFLDDLFIVHVEWLRELAERFPAEVGLPFFCNVRAKPGNGGKDGPAQESRLCERGHGPGDGQRSAAQSGPEAQPVQRAAGGGKPHHPRSRHPAADDEHAGPAGRHPGP
jgi:anaerobic magnesium-protoporphyrin IX monomethyl ester cyclase